ncbi:unnamed protein product [Chrysoparadoxa australica]
MAVHVDKMVQITLDTGETLKGLLYTEDSVTGTLVVKQRHQHTSSTCHVRFINRKAVTSLEILDEQVDEVLLHQTQPVSEKELAKKEAKALQEVERALAQINRNASSEGQALFDALAKTMECDWEGESIRVYDQVRIDPPYTPADCTSLDGIKQALQRVQKVLEGERLKLAAAGRNAP